MNSLVGVEYLSPSLEKMLTFIENSSRLRLQPAPQTKRVEFLQGETTAEELKNLPKNIIF
jgi:hypothetical protein